MKKQKNKQAIKASKLAKAENKLKHQAEQIITVKNAEGEPNTQAKILVQNKIDYTPKVSVIIPVYNVEEYLRECLDSVVNQTLKEIEIICVDDGSTDKSLEILKEYAKKDNRITVISQENLHAGVARNAGLAVAKGEYLSFLDSDDFFELNMLEETYKKAKADDADIIMFNAYLFNDVEKKDIEVSWTLRADWVNSYQVFNYKNIPDLVFRLSNCWVWNRLYKSSFINKYRLNFQSLRCANDTYFSCISQVLAKKIIILDIRLVHYRTNRENSHNTTSSSVRQRSPQDLLNCFITIYKKLKEIKVFNTIEKSYMTVAIEHIFWSKNGIACNKEAYIKFVTYFVKEYKELFRKQSFNSDNNEINKKYVSLRNILVDNGCFNEIPKRVFYVWGANEPKKQSVIDCMKTWYKFLPEYEIIEINENSVEYFNFKDELKHNKWFATVYDKKMWAYVADYIRVNTLYKSGGIYFDTDVSVIKNMDKFLHEKSFVGIQMSSLDGTGDWVEPAICGSQKNNLFFKGVASFYNTLIWKEPIYTMPQVFNYFLKKYDIFPFPEKRKQKIIYLSDITIYPERYFIPYRFRSQYDPNCIEKDTYTIHWWSGSWVKPEILEFLQNKHKAHNGIKVSVIVPVYNTGLYLRECLDSIINQTLKEIEIICINDGSTDNSLDILNEYAKKDKRIIIINQKNQGLACSRNNALKIVKGEYLQFVDSDDVIKIDACEKLYRKAQKNNLDMLSFSGYNFSISKDQREENKYWSFEWTPLLKGKEIFNYKDCKSFMNKIAVSSCLTIYKRELIEKNNLYFPPHICYEDNLFFLKAFTKSERISFDKTEYYMRRIHSEAITQNMNKNFIDYIYITDLVLNYLDKFDKSLYDIYVNAYIGRCTSIYKSLDKQYQKKYKKRLKILLKKYGCNQVHRLEKKNYIRAYLQFIFNKINFAKTTRKLSLLQLKSARIDIKNFGNENNAIGIETSAKVSKPTWFLDKQGQGQIVESSKKFQSLKIKAIQDGKLRLDFRGQDKRFEGVRFPVWIDYKSIKIDGKEILSAPVATWHDKPFRYEMPVKNGQIVKVDVVQKYHQYTKDELKDVILKLNPNSDYIKENIDKITDRIYKKIFKNQTPYVPFVMRLKSEFQAKLKLLQNKFSFAHKIAPLTDLILQNQKQTLQALQEIKTKNAALENQNKELKKEIDILKNTVNQKLVVMEENLAHKLGEQKEVALQNKDNIITDINQVKENLQTKVKDFQDSVNQKLVKLDNLQENLNALSSLKEINLAQKDELNALSKMLGEQNSQFLDNVRELQYKSQRHYQELNFADLLHDSTSNSPWLKDKNFALYGWAANYSFIYTLFRILDNVKPAHILEMGLGQTSVLTSQYVANNNHEAKLDIIENDESWIKVYEPKLAKSQNIKLHQCDIEFIDYDGAQSRKYKEINKITKDKKYNLIIVDGPFGGGQKLPRSNIVELVEHNLAQDFIIIFDDAERKGEQNTIAQTKAKLTELGIEFGTQQRDALKSQYLIFSKSYELAKYL